MAFARPTLATLVSRIRADFRSRLEISGSLVRRATADVFAATWAGAVHLVHGHLEWLAEQLFANTAIAEYLKRKAAIWGITPTPATFASGTVEATATDTATIPTGTIFVRDDGATYESTSPVTFGPGGGTDSVPVTAQEAGAAGGMETDDTLELESPITNVNSTVTVEAPGLTGGNDEESTEDLRARFLLRLREPPEGGNDQDYEAWALAVAGVTRAWVYRHESGLGTVTVRFVRDNDSGTIIPDSGEVTAVQNAIDAERPTTADVTVAAPTLLTQGFTIEITPDTAAIRAAVQAELEDLFYREGEPGDGAGRGTIAISKIRTAIGVAEGVDDYTLTVPSADVVPSLGQLPAVGTITWA